ncbi:tRNA uridine(34) 5-carboxymethylaminomethyl modification radical SAM/GNAT enzyme Elp3 [Candidatus Woesearchaeota archaeon]|nr:tRNA uridine(34) 5-carboxymethylaminomethyl modification radical SAM/GNAT enzyme Elp3 [Candidatus Woesearchaeota archaeon]
MPKKEYYKEIISILKEKKLSKEEIAKLKIKLCKKHKCRKIPTDIQVLLNASVEDLKKLKLVTKPTRTISGVAVVAIMSQPFECPHGKCMMCPSNVTLGIPQSYTGNEPATMRGLRNKFDSYLQVFNRLEQYVALGQNFEKVELIIMGGTFLSFLDKYKQDFIKYAFKALNDFSDMFFDNGRFNVIRFREFFELPGDIQDEKRGDRIRKKIKDMKGKCELFAEQIKNDKKSKVKCVGLTIETRPDFGYLKHGNEMLSLGATRVEIGVQSVYDDVLEKICRGHTVSDSKKSIKELKDLGFKLNFHYMPGLPGVDEKKDLEGMKKLFLDLDFRPDMLKIYPAMVMPKTKLYDEWKAGKFRPITTKKAMKLIKEFKKHIPSYVRVMRVQRDIPTKVIAAGVDKTNLRQLIEEEGHECNCIRCREVGHIYAKKGKKPKEVEIRVHEYDASDGKEFFISAEDFKQNILVGFARLRFPAQCLRKEITKDSALVREVHVYGTATSIGEEGKVQHKGWGRKLLKKAEDVAKKHKKKKVIVISGVGVREYYKKFGYKLEGPYMTKKI